MKGIVLSQGKVAKVDYEDYPELSKYKWSAYASGHTFYAARYDENGKYIAMHRQIMNTPDDMEVDHKNGDGLDNRRKRNLRNCTKEQNMYNRKATVGGCGRKGVSFCNRDEVYIAEIRKGDYRETVGRFSNRDDAARAYDKAALRLFGEFARLNFPPEEEPDNEVMENAEEVEFLLSLQKLDEIFSYKGAYFDKRSEKWGAMITRKGKVEWLGTFKTQEEAALAYNVAAYKYFGPKARLNVIPGTIPKEGGLITEKEYYEKKSEFLRLFGNQST